MAESETSPSDEAERQKEVDMLYKKMSVERHERLKKDMRDLITRFRMRGQKYEDKVSKPLSPTAEEFNDLDDLVAKKKEQQEKRPLVDYEIVEDIDPYKDLSFHIRIFKYIFDPLSINPQSWQMTILMGIQTIVMMYNAWSIPFGLCFTFYRANDFMNWLYYDLVADIIYLIDTIYFRPRMMYLDPHGIYEKRRKMTFLNFVKAGSFKKDALSLLPFDWIYVLILGPQFYAYMSLFRLPRLLRYYNLGIFFDRLDQNLPFPLIIRLTRTVNTMVYLVHVPRLNFILFVLTFLFIAHKKISFS